MMKVLRRIGSDAVIESHDVEDVRYLCALFCSDMGLQLSFLPLLLYYHFPSWPTTPSLLSSSALPAPTAPEFLLLILHWA